MTLMTDDIEWYPLPEVEEDEDDSPVQVVSSHSTVSTAASRTSATSATLSQSYLTPASSVLSRQSHSDPHVTGTIQPYLKKADGQLRRRTTLREGHSGSDSTTESRGSDIRPRASTSLRQKSDGRKTTSGIGKQRSVSVPKRTSSTVSFKVGKVSSGVSLKDGRSTSSFQTAASSVSWRSHESAAEASASFHCDSSPQYVVRDKSVDVDNFQAVHSLQSVTTSAGVGTTIEHHPPLPTVPQLSTGPTVTSTPTDPRQTDLLMNTSTSETAALPMSQPISKVFTSGLQPPPGKQPGTISLVELDQLWKDFIASSLGSQETENREGSTRHCAVHTTLQSTTSQSRGEPLRELNEERVFETRDAAIQTTPSLALSQNPSTTPTTSHHYQHALQPTVRQSPRLSHLTLQESLRILRPDFVRHSEQRQKTLKRNRELRSHQCRAPEPRYPRHSAKERNHRPQFVLIDVTKNRPKMSPLEMYRNSKRYWCKLPEVQQKAREQKKASEAATNRLRMKLYQQEVLGRLRQKIK